MDHNQSTGDTSPLDSLSVAVYRLALRDGRLVAAVALRELGLSEEELARAVASLCRLNLVRSVPGDADWLAPVRPDAAAESLIGEQERELRRQQDSVNRIRDDLMTLMPVYDESRRERSREQSIEVLAGPDSIRTELQLAAERCRAEVMTMQPGGGRSAAVLADALPRDVAMLRRGVRMRILYQHTSRRSLPTQSYVARVTEAGAEVRTAEELPERLIIFDREIAFVPERMQPDRGIGAAVVRDEVVVRFMAAIFDAAWRQATPFVGDEGSAAVVVDGLKRTIVGMLASGAKDEVVARRLGMSVRTCRRYVADLMLELGAASRFQAGVEAARLGLVESAQSVPEED